ncbi:MAG: hypothetical protein P9L97_12700 [Candidatus Tenebribacter davisii]|nr:hypothetical protein [Candidatus Tenebribacter davisii]
MKILLLMALFLIPLYANSQETTNSTEVELKYWSFSIILAGRIGGPGEDIEDAMIEAEFNKFSPASWFGSGNSHPHSRMGKASFILGVKRYIKPLYSISIIFGNIYLGTTLGYHDQAGFLFIDYSSSCFAPIISINLYDILRIGTGPALYFTKAWKTISSLNEEDESYKITKVGLMIDSGIRIPWRSAFFAEFTTQYRKVGQVEIGPFTAGNSNNMAELPKTEVNYDHWIIGLGLGFRF